MRYATLVAAALGCLIASGLCDSVKAQTTTTKVMAVSDGDSIKIMRGCSTCSAILFGIDAPELRQAAGLEARKFVDSRCFHQNVTVEDRGTDSHGRLIVVVYLADGTNLNQELVKQGLAWWSDKYAPNDSTLKQLQAAARTAHKGLWAEAKPIPPWEFRNGQKSVQAIIKPSSGADD